MKFLPLLLFTFFLIGCEKSVENFTPYPGGVSDTAWVANNSASLEINALHQELMTAPLSDTFDLQTGATIHFGTATRIEIPNAAFTTNSVSASGTGRLDLYLLKSKGDLIRFRKPTVSSSNLLNTSNTFLVNVSKHGQALTMPGPKSFRINLADTFTSGFYKGFLGVEPPQSSFSTYLWGRSDSLQVQVSTNAYQIITNRQQWTSLSYGIDSTTLKSRTVLSMPPAFTNANTTAFVVFKNNQTVIQFTPDYADRIWLADKVPSGKPVIYLTLTKKGNNYWLGSQEMVTASNQNIRIIPIQKSLPEINSYLSSL
jgi:hypothetical protein